MELKLNFKGGGLFINLKPQFSSSSETIFVAWKNQILAYATKTGLLICEFHGIKDEIVGFNVHEYDSHECITACSKTGEVITWKVITRFKILTKKLPIPKIKAFKLILPVEENKFEALVVHQQKEKISFSLFDIFSCKGQKARFTIKDQQPFHFDVSNQYFAVAHRSHLAFVKFDQLQTVYDHFTSADKTFTSIQCHPTEEIALTGDQTGRVVAWENIFSRKAEQAVFHWHTLPVRCLSFSVYGSTFYSGGEECVMVRWQFDNKHDKSFLPRLPATLRQISVSNSYIAIATEDNAIKIVGFRNENVALIQHLVIGEQEQDQIVVDSKSKALVMNGNVGQIQFYSPNTKTLLYSVDVVGANKITNERTVCLENIKVRKIAVSKSGNWLATVEERQDAKYSNEMRMKFWWFDMGVQNFKLNTCIESPHDGTVNAVLFQPVSNEEELLCVTVGSDKKFKVWKLNDSTTIYHKGNCWNFHCSGYYHDLPCLAASFSIDGSLVAVSFAGRVTTWIPDNCELKCALIHTKFKEEEIRHVHFGGQKNVCHLLVAASSKRIFVWNILTLTLIWTVNLQDKIQHLIADSVTANMAVITKKNEVFVFEPNSPVPVFSNKSLLKGDDNVIACAFVPSKFSNDVRLKWWQRSPILLVNEKREMYSIGADNDEIIEEELMENEEKSYFSQMLPNISSKDSDVSKKGVEHMYAQETFQRNVKKYFDTPIHTMIPVRLICGPMLRSVLLQKTV